MKDSFLDVKATLASGKIVIIEMQVLNVLDFKQRVLYNAAKAFAIQLDSGEGYDALNPVVALTITDFSMFDTHQKVVSRYQLKEEDELTNYSDDIELVFAELPKFNKSLDELASLTDKWLYFLKEASHLEAIPERLGQEPEIQNAFEIARQSRLTRDEIEALDRQMRVIRDSRGAVLLGIRQGIEQGIEQGEKRANLKMARSLLSKLSVAEISQITGLTASEIERLSAAD